MEDRTLVALDLERTLAGQTLSLFGVFDGHGGDQAADFVARMLPKVLCESIDLAPAEDIVGVVSSAFKALDAELRTYIEAKGFALAGCTASVCIFSHETSDGKPRRVYCANCGDSRSVSCRAGGNARELSTDQKPILPAELKRIEAAGGKVDDNGRINGGLNVSRAFGDFGYKKRQDLPVEEQLVIAVPEVREFELGDDEFLAMGTDGVFDVLTSQQLVSDLRRLTQDEGQSLEAAVGSILQRAVESDDNVSLCVVQLKA
eukprot:TRINITY_DN28755_c0_g1_i1.p1 TRINITY_DN28755_c0_g1~~TRINITY_DN28755_c0_g1_i1.p1  ORF type:complete len:260 (-),score=42.51 TRINITY_DN28755_c0_g1_i1:59-838(-)